MFCFPIMFYLKNKKKKKGQIFITFFFLLTKKKFFFQKMTFILLHINNKKPITGENKSLDIIEIKTIFYPFISKQYNH